MAWRSRCRFCIEEFGAKNGFSWLLTNLIQIIAVKPFLPNVFQNSFNSAREVVPHEEPELYQTGP
jgi:hypothetical protein